ncbi:MAG: MFS transporter [Pseudomonadales bacterium]|jgi:benzoate transport|nr:MFS transporter [Pseudomonadales bacterium]
MTDPREIIDKSAMTTLQYVIVAITVLLNGMDGFDVLAISVSSRGIQGEFGIGQEILCYVLSAELVGMAIGSVRLGGVSDKIGRRNMLLGCLVVMAGGMFIATTATNLITLGIYRVITGLGIGGMLSTTNAVVAEFSNNKHRGLCISLMVIGYPLGGIVCGEVGKALLAADGLNWRVMFMVGGVLSAALIPITYFLVPESVHWLARRQPESALTRINAALSKLGHKIVDALPAIETAQLKASVLDIFSPALRMTTILVTLAYFTHIVTFYFILKWTPAIVGEMGFPANLASGVLTWANVGGAAGGAVFGLLTSRIGLKPLSIGIVALTGVGVAIYGQTSPDLTMISMLACLAGFFGNAGVSGLYTIVAYVFPTHLRATGTGFVIGVGRGGAVLAPIMAGYLLGAFKVEGVVGSGVASVALIMAIGSLLGAIVLTFLKMGTDKPATSPNVAVGDAKLA